jgi:hypothetical protein
MMARQNGAPYPETAARQFHSVPRQVIHVTEGYRRLLTCRVRRKKHGYGAPTKCPPVVRALTRGAVPAPKPFQDLLDHCAAPLAWRLYRRRRATRRLAQAAGLRLANLRGLTVSLAGTGGTTRASDVADSE